MLRGRKLIWENLDNDTYRCRAPFFGNFRIEKYGSKYHVTWSAPGYSSDLIEDPFDTVEDAKGAMQALFDAKIREIAVLSDDLEDDAPEEPRLDLGIFRRPGNEWEVVRDGATAYLITCSRGRFNVIDVANAPLGNIGPFPTGEVAMSWITSTLMAELAEEKGGCNAG